MKSFKLVLILVICFFVFGAIIPVVLNNRMVLAKSLSEERKTMMIGQFQKDCKIGLFVLCMKNGNRNASLVVPKGSAKEGSSNSNVDEVIEEEIVPLGYLTESITSSWLLDQIENCKLNGLVLVESRGIDEIALLDYDYLFSFAKKEFTKEDIEEVIDYLKNHLSQEMFVVAKTLYFEYLKEMKE